MYILINTETDVNPDKKNETAPPTKDIYYKTPISHLPKKTYWRQRVGLRMILSNDWRELDVDQFRTMLVVIDDVVDCDDNNGDAGDYDDDSGGDDALAQ